MGELEKHARIFNLIAPVYNWFFHRQVKTYSAIFARYGQDINLPQRGKVLDIGCGTGALLYSLAERGFEAVGVDFSESMLKAAKKSTGNLPVQFYRADVTRGLAFPDQSFEFVVSSYVLHGLSSGLRHRIYAEAGRLSRGPVLFYDYNKKRRILTDLIEWAEGGDYFNFVDHGEQEMRDFFARVDKFEAGPQTALYVCQLPQYKG